MSFINFQSFDPIFLETKAKQNLLGLKICVPPQHKHSYKKLSSYVRFANFVKSGWSDLKEHVQLRFGGQKSGVFWK